MNCPVCHGSERPFFVRRLLGKYDVQYYFCATCGLLHTEKPYWLGEAYSDAIVATDVGIARRNVSTSVNAAAVWGWLYKGNGKFIDLAGGYGLFVRLMRDMGFDYYWTDPYASNVFARGFTGVLGGPVKYQAATALEVLEHTESPLDFLRNAFRDTGCDSLLFTTELYTGSEPPQDWWYYGLNTGQHISIFHRRTLEHIARTLELHFCSSGSTHLLSRIAVSPATFALLNSRVVSKLLPVVAGRLFGSKIMDDHLELVRIASGQPPT